MDVPEVAIETNDAAATRELAESLGRSAEAGLVVLLTGQLGAGKTTFVQGMANGMDVVGRVTSPTFALIHEHEARRQGQPRLVHVDLYRLEVAEAADLGLAEILDSGDVVAVEWPERATGLEGGDFLRAELTIVSDSSAEAAVGVASQAGRRRIRLTATGAVSGRVLGRLAADPKVGEVLCS